MDWCTKGTHEQIWNIEYQYNLKQLSQIAPPICIWAIKTLTMWMTRIQICICHYTLTMPQAGLNSEWEQSHQGVSAGKAAVPRQAGTLTLPPASQRASVWIRRKCMIVTRAIPYSAPHWRPHVPFELNFRKFQSLNSLISSTSLPNFSHCDTLVRYLRNRIKKTKVSVSTPRSNISQSFGRY